MSNFGHRFVQPGKAGALKYLKPPQRHVNTAQRYVLKQTRINYFVQPSDIFHFPFSVSAAINNNAEGSRPMHHFPGCQFPCKVSLCGVTNNQLLSETLPMAPQLRIPQVIGISKVPGSCRLLLCLFKPDLFVFGWNCEIFNIKKKINWKFLNSILNE